MRLNLYESGIQNIKQIAKQYNKAIIYFHMDCDGVTAAISMREYLKQYGIQTVAVQKIQYGSLEYAISKPKSADVLPVLVDFAHGKTFIKIHTDHHDSQIAYDTASKNFRHAPSNAGTISGVISSTNIFPPEDIRIIDMVDSAGYKKENVNMVDMLKAVLKPNVNANAWRNHLQMGMIVNKLLLTFKNRKGFLEDVVMKSQPSLESMYNVMIGMIKEHIANNDKGFISPDQIEQNSKEYYDQQSGRKIPDGAINDIDTVSYGSALKIGNTVFQISGGNMRKAGMYDRYTVFRLYPNIKYFVMCWDSLGMIQVSKNPWGDDEDGKNLGELVINDIFKTKYESLLGKWKYDVSLLTIKSYYESSINDENMDEAVGFDYNELIHLFDQNFDNLSAKQQFIIKKWLDWSKGKYEKMDFDDDDSDEIDEKIIKKNQEIDKAITYLNKLKISLPTIIEKTSGGHPSITNLSGFGFIEYQKQVDKAVENGENPMDIKKKLSFIQPKYDTTSVKIMKSICKDVIRKLNEINV